MMTKRWNRRKDKKKKMWSKKQIRACGQASKWGGTQQGCRRAEADEGKTPAYGKIKNDLIEWKGRDETKKHHNGDSARLNHSGTTRLFGTGSVGTWRELKGILRKLRIKCLKNHSTKKEWK